MRLGTYLFPKCVVTLLNFLYPMSVWVTLASFTFMFGHPQKVVSSSLLASGLARRLLGQASSLPFFTGKTLHRLDFLHQRFCLYGDRSYYLL